MQREVFISQKHFYSRKEKQDPQILRNQPIPALLRS